MPKIILPLEDTKDSILRPIMTDITYQLNLAMGLPQDLPMYYPDESGTIMQHMSRISKEYKNAHHGSKLNADNLVSIEVDEIWDENEIAATPTYQPEAMPVFRDDHLGIVLRPVYVPCILNINYRYRCQDRAMAEMWRNHMRAKASHYGLLVPHNLKYHYLIPEEFIAILHHIHELRENIAGYGESFLKYLTSKGQVHGSVRLTTLTNFKGHQQRLGITENQTRVFGGFEFDSTPERGSRQQENETWEVSFTYKVRYSRPIEMIMEYPLMVHQQPLMEPFIPSADDRMYYMGLGRERNFNRSSLALEEFTAQTAHLAKDYKKGISIPDYDEWLPKPTDTPPGVRRIYDLMISLSHDKPDRLVSLLDVEEIEFGSKMIEFMKEESKYMHLQGGSVFNVGLYNQWALLHNNYIEVDDELYVVSKLDLTLRNMYHIRLGVYEDWTKLTQRALDRLQRRPDIVRGILIFLGFDIGMINNWFRGLHEKYHHVDTPNAYRGMQVPIWRNEYGQLVVPPSEDEYTTWDKWDKIPQYLWYKLIYLVSNKIAEDVRIFTVQTSFVTAYRREDNDIGINYKA